MNRCINILQIAKNTEIFQLPIRDKFALLLFWKEINLLIFHGFFGFHVISFEFIARCKLQYKDFLGN